MGRSRTLTVADIDQMTEESPTKGLYLADMHALADWVEKKGEARESIVTSAAWLSINAAYRIGYLRGMKHRKR